MSNTKHWPMLPATELAVCTLTDITAVTFAAAYVIVQPLPEQRLTKKWSMPAPKRTKMS